MDSGRRRNALDGALKAHAALIRRRCTLDSVFPQLGEKWMQPEERSVASVRRSVRDTAIDWNAAKGIPESAELLTDTMVALQNEDVVAAQSLGDQAGGGLGGVQRVQGRHYPGHFQLRQQGASGRALAPFARDLALAQDHPVLVADRPDSDQVRR